MKKNLILYSGYDRLPDEVTDAPLLDGCLILEGGGWRCLYTQGVLDAMMQAGIAFATQQIVDLYANGINAVHVYSMNNAKVAGQIRENLSQIVK